MLEAISVVRLDWTDYSLSPFGAEVTGIGQLRETWSSRLIYCRSWRYSRGLVSQKLYSPEQSDTERQYAWRCCDEPDIWTKRQHSNCHCRQLKPTWDCLDKTYTPYDRAIEPVSLRRTQLCIRGLGRWCGCARSKFRLPWDCSIAEFEAVSGCWFPTFHTTGEVQVSVTDYAWSWVQAKKNVVVFCAN